LVCKVLARNYKCFQKIDLGLMMNDNIQEFMFKQMKIQSSRLNSTTPSKYATFFHPVRLIISKELNCHIEHLPFSRKIFLLSNFMDDFMKARLSEFNNISFNFK
jgi:hypothetical protein